MSSSQPPLSGRVEDRSLEEEMRSSYIEYAMSVIVGRALPDVRDGLKPVHRRVLYAMHEQGLQPNRAYRKCASIVGEVMGNYHPHGDSAIYDALARLAQDFAIRQPLVDGQGNFGSIDGDRPAAMRYTEARLSRISPELLRDIDSDTVDFVPNYDGRMLEPSVLPARFPNLLVNGSTGIAVGMATNIPPHNLGEVIDATVALIDNPEIDLDGLMQHIEGPDFPTGAAILGRKEIRSAFETGRGRVRMQAICHVEPIGQGKEAIIVTELPYMVKKGGDDGLIQKIAGLARDKKLPEISDLRDESDRNGMRLVIELKRDALPEVVKNKLFKHTPMQQTFGVNMVALVDRVPKLLSLKQMLQYYLSHQKEVITRRAKYELRKSEARAHILSGLLIAVANIDAVVALIRASSDPDAARSSLMEKFDLSRVQAQAILDLRLQRLTALESDKIQSEFDDLAERIKELRQLLGSEELIYGVIREELLETREQFADPRRTRITDQEADMKMEDLIADRQMVISITNSGYIKSLPLDTYRSQRRGGVGIKGMETKEDDYIEHLFISSTHDYLLFFTNRGKVYRQKVYELPEASRTSRGRALVNLLPLREGERVQAVISTRDFTEAKYLAFATKNGQVKKTEFLAYNTPIKADGIIAINIRDDDELVAVRLTTGDDTILMISRSGHAVRFKEEQARPMGRDTGGVRGMNVSKKGNAVIAMEVASDEADMLVVTEGGYGKRTKLSEYPIKGRGTMGVLTIKLTEKKGALVAALIVRPGEELLFMSQNGMVQRTRVDEISQYKRAAQGVRLMNIKDEDLVSAVAPVMESDVEDVDGDDVVVDSGQDELVPDVAEAVEGETTDEE
ncbi:MAG: DNA gyrase subunit A [Thermoleophilaceae bacterium]|nr:DNA gyrase subunit A [Thermoleophilaceae bacterium]